MKLSRRIVSRQLLALISVFQLFSAYCKTGNHYEPTNDGKTIRDYDVLIENAGKGEITEKPLWKLYEERGQLRRPGSNYAQGPESDDQFTKALADFDKAIALFSDANNGKLSNLHNSRSAMHTGLYMSQGGDDHRKAAVDDITKSIELDSSSPELLNRRAGLYLKVFGEPEKAEADAVAALRITYSRTYRAWQIISAYELLVEIYTTLQQRAGNTPAAVRYGELLATAREGVKKGNLLKLAEMKAVMDKLEADSQARLRYQLEQQEAQQSARRDAAMAEAKKHAGHRHAQCTSCNGSGRIFRMSSKQSTLNTYETDRGTMMKRTTTGEDAGWHTCPVCFGQGFTEQ